MTAQIMIAVTMLVFMITVSYGEQSARLIPPEVEKAVLAGDWEQIAKLLKDVDPNSNSPVKRLIKGHAYLAMNRNNDSFRLLAAATPEGLSVWERWSSGLAKVNPLNSYAHFYSADALARLGQHEKAIRAFNKAIELDANNAYALHGRGVLYAQLGKYKEAGKDLAAAQSAAPEVADFHNSRGMLRIAQRNGSVVRLAQQFKRATELSQDFALAYHGLGCISLLRDPSGPQEPLTKARSLLEEARAAFALNETSFEIALVLSESDVSALGDTQEPGATIERKITAQQMGHLAEQFRIHSDAEKSIPWTNPFGRHEASTRRRVLQTAINLAVDRMSDQEIAKMNVRTHSTVLEATRNERKSASTHASLARTSEWTAAAAMAYGSKNAFLSAGTKVAMEKHNTFTHEYNRMTARNLDRVRHIEPLGQSLNMTPASPRPTTPNPGGVAIDRHEVSWDDRPWPFSPIFGLAYGLSTDNELYQETNDAEFSTEGTKVEGRP